ncbi:MAG: hypothetical protein V3T05_11245 [Myxococcota bacterium]
MMLRPLARALCSVVVAAAVVSAPVGDSVAANRHLKRARKAHRALRYDDVLPLLKKALRIAEHDKERFEIYVTMAEMHIIYDREVEARKAYVEALSIQQDFELPEESSPKLLVVLQDARVQLGLLIGGKKNGDDQGVVSDGDPEEGSGDVVDDPRPDAEDGATGDGRAGTGDESEFGTTVVGATDVGGSGSGATRLPDPMLTAPTEISAAIYEQWWFWTAIGVVVVGGAGAGVYGATRSPEPPDGDFGPYPLP